MLYDKVIKINIEAIQQKYKVINKTFMSLFTKNLDKNTQQRTNINEFQNWSKYPLLVAADYERGLGQWMNGATLFPSNMAVAATGDKALAYDQGVITALEASAIGVHITFSPVMDVNNNSENP